MNENEKLKQELRDRDMQLNKALDIAKENSQGMQFELENYTPESTTATNPPTKSGGLKLVK